MIGEISSEPKFGKKRLILFKKGSVSYKLTEPFLNKIRRFLPNLGSLDISPIILLLLIWFIEMCMKLYIAPIIF